MASNLFLSIKKDEHNSEILYRLRTEWNNKSCNIVILADTAAYHGQITKEDIQRMSKMFKWTEDAYIEECKSSFHPNLNPGLYTYGIEQNWFVVRKILNDKKGKVKLVNIMLKRVDFQETIYGMLDASMKRITDMTVELENSKKENDTIQRNYEVAVQRLEEMVQLKTQCNIITSTQFLSLLNSKKAKLASLMNPQPSSNENQRVESIDVDHDMSDDSAYSVETDEMDEMETVSDESPSREPNIQQMEDTRTTNLESVSSEQERINNDGKESESSSPPRVSNEEEKESSIISQQSEFDDQQDETLNTKNVASSSKAENTKSPIMDLKTYLNLDLLDPTVRLKKK